MSKEITFIIKNSFDNVELVSNSINKILSNNNFNESFCYDIELAITENLNNCIEHAYKNDIENNKDIIINFKLLNNTIFFKIEDFGDNYEHIQKNKTIDFDINDIENLPEGGFGLNIIEQIMDKVISYREGNKNITILEKSF
ncbi:MAG: ATP-binding protein [Candidatus Sericytochromatia bacterium]